MAPPTTGRATGRSIGEGLRICGPQRKPSLPSVSTKRTEASYLRAIFEQAKKWGYVNAQTI
jgi:hypothetical protein